MTLWKASSIDEAIARAEKDAQNYADSLGGTFVGLLQAFSLEEAPGDGVEVFSLVRDSDLDANAYVSRFFDTGTERQQMTD